VRERLSTIDLVEAFQLAHAVAALEKEALFASLQKPTTALALAKRHGLDASLLHGTLEYVAARTDLLRKRGSRFVATDRYGPATAFLIHHYVGTYGKNASELAKLLHAPELAPTLVDRRSYAKAFAAAGGHTSELLLQLVRLLRLNHVLDLGSGPAALLVQLASHDASFFGMGIEQNPAMLRLARRSIQEHGLAERLSVYSGDGAAPAAALPSKVRARVQALTASNLANEFFGHGDSKAVAWLRRLRETFPGRPLLIADYYGRLGTTATNLPVRAVLQDFAQLTSGQGIPPKDLLAWRRLYRKAGCRFVHALEAGDTTSFVHLVKL
jgi:hypothetical protein